jgi:hypothetical protein
MNLGPALIGFVMILALFAVCCAGNGGARR